MIARAAAEQAAREIVQAWFTDPDCIGLWGAKSREILIRRIAAALQGREEALSQGMRRVCTCLGHCYGEAGLGEGWVCALKVSPSAAPERREP